MPRLVSYTEEKSNVTGRAMFLTTVVPDALADEYESRKRRFDFLFPRDAQRGTTYSLKRPDLCELRWSVWNHLTLRTMAFGATPEDAVDAALSVVASERDQAIGWRRDELFAQGVET